jgi:predicted phage baseplate assembly protein
VIVPKGTQAQTAGSETEAPVAFETDQDVQILSVNMKSAVQVGKFTYTNASSLFTVPPATGELLSILGGPPHQSVQLCFGFDAATAQTINLMLRLFKPLDPTLATVSWVFSSGALQPSQWTAIPVTPLQDGTNSLQQDGIVQLNVPNTWAPQAPTSWTVTPQTPADAVTNAYFWIGLRIGAVTNANAQVGLKWTLFNSVSSYNALTIAAPESVGIGTGAPFQVYPLANGPLFQRPNTDTPYDHLVVQVNGVTWSQVDDFPNGPGTFYRVNPVTSEITFGNYDPLQAVGHGNIPAVGDLIVATTYRYVAGGLSGNVGGGTIIAMRTPVAGITGVINPFSAYGGSDQEAIADTERRAPQLLRNRYRAVTAEDYEFLAAESSTELATVRCLQPRDDYAATSFGGLDRSAGNVHVIILPNIAPALSGAPQPTEELVHEVVRYLDRRRDITSRLNVTGPRYLPIDVTVAASVWQKAIDGGLIQGASDIQTYIVNQITKYLHPVVGGLDGRGWQVGQNVFIADLYKAITPSVDIGFISSLQIQGAVPLYTPPTRPFAPSPLGSWVRLADYELVCLGTPNVIVTVQAGVQ